MNEREKVARRVEAAATGQAVLTRAARTLAADPEVTLGIATVKIVTEEHVQAVAFGRMDEEPNVIARIDPLGRDATDLEPFAEWLISNVDGAVGAGILPRIWIPHAQTLETLDILGHRYERNESASQALQRMGTLCRIIARECRYAGQQVVAVASAVLMDHVATGQSAAEDGHLGALLAWINPPQGISAVDYARERSIAPASGVLANYPGRQDDERVENLRRAWKRASGLAKQRLENQIRSIVRQAALDEWALLREAHQSFWNLPLDDGDLGECVATSKERVFYKLESGINAVPRRPMPRVREMAALENSLEQEDAASLNGDRAVRFKARQKGKVLGGEITQIEQPKSNRKPCTVTIQTAQRDLRFRRDEKIKLAGAQIVGRILSIAYDDVSGGTVVTLNIEDGVRLTGSSLSIGAESEWVSAKAFSLFAKNRVLNGVAEPWMLNPEGIVPQRRAAKLNQPELLFLAESFLRGRS